jgi:hypothetical protein
LEGYALLFGADLGGQYTVTQEHDPVKFHGINLADYFDPADYFDEGDEYMNE